MSTTSSNSPRWGWRELFRCILWLSVAYACIVAFECLEFLTAAFASLMLVMLFGLLDDMTGRH